MKKIRLLLSMTLLMTAISMLAVPAKREKVKVQQPDGTYVTISLLGDEWCHFTTTADGYTVVKDTKGFYVYAQKKAGQLKATGMVAHDADMRSVAEEAYLQSVDKFLKPEMTQTVQLAREQEMKSRALARQQIGKKANTYENFKGLIILVEFNDKSFSREDYATIVEDMVNKENYTGFDNEVYTGSVHDYFLDNSNGKFNTSFDIIGPIQVDRSQYYPNGLDNVAQLNYEVVQAANPLVNFKDYDRDNNGYVDMIYFIFAGNGSNIGGNDSRLIWPHASIIYNPATQWYVTMDGVRLERYACSTELYGRTGRSQIDGIGTICHEFSHVMGIPDLYDTDYSESGGESNHPAEWSIMAGGSYLNDSRTPAGYTLFEKYFFGFSTPTTIKSLGSYTLEPLAKTHTGYRLDSPVNKEYFLLENRQRTQKWDAALPGQGMLVFRVDSTNASVWSLQSNSVNKNPAHNYFELVRARTNNTGYGRSSDPFPGTYNVTELSNITTPGNLKTWAGKANDFGLRNIKTVNGNITFDVFDANILTAITLPATATTNIGAGIKLQATLVPESTKNKLTWSTGNKNVATVSQDGVVTGVAVGTAVITVTSDNNLSAQCTVTVEDNIVVNDIAAFKQLPTDTKIVLRLINAQVLYVNSNNVYLRDASGSILLTGSTLSLNNTAVMNGIIIGSRTSTNDVPVINADQTFDMSVGVTVTEGTAAEPVIVTDVSSVDQTQYANLITLQGIEMQRTTYEGLSGLFAVMGGNYIRLFNTFGINGITVPSNYAGKTYDVTGILTTRQSTNGAIVKELALLQSPKESVYNGIVNITHNADATATYYTLDGRRVESVGTSGIYIERKGNTARKIFIK